MLQAWVKDVEDKTESPLGPYGYWKGKGILVDIKDMDEDHLQNTVKLLYRRIDMVPPEKVKYYKSKITELEDELRSR